MRLLLPWAALAILAAAAFAQDDAPPPIDADQKEIVAKIREKALSYGKDLPDFVCNKVTRLNLDPSGTSQQWRLTETVNDEVTYSNHKQTVQSVSGKKSGSQAASSDEFGTLLDWIFDPKVKTDFQWNSWTTLNKRRTYVFSYKVAETDSRFMVGTGKTRMAVAFTGLVWADVDTGMVVRVLATGQSPKGFVVQGVQIETIYDFIKVGDQELVLPVKSDYRAREGKALVWNETEFRRYRKPG